jgi:hypothetical protein
MALSGEEAAHRAELSVMAVGFRADHAFALWKCGDATRAIGSFATVLETFDKLPRPQDDLHSYALQIRVDYALSWVLKSLRGNHTQPEPFPACFSDSEVDESYKEYQIRPVVLLWNALAHIEFETKSGKEIFKRLQAANKNDSIVDIDLLIKYLRIRHSLREFDTNSLISYISNLLKVSDALRKALIEHDTKLNDGELHPDLLIVPDHSMKIHFVIKLLFAAFVIFLSRKIERELPLEKWKTDAERLGLLNTSLADWFAFIEESPQKSLAQLVAVMRNVEEGENRFVAALLITATEIVNPEDRFYADVLLVLAMHSDVWWRDIEHEIEGFITTGWSKTATEQSFALRSPRINSPAILAVCQDPSSGLIKVARILLKAKNAVSLSVSEEIVSQLRELAHEG